MENSNNSLHIGTLKGKILVFGGVYSNLQTLEEMQRIAADLGIAPSNIICTGDVVGYCAQPEACVQAVREWGVHCIAGNVEIQLAKGQTDCGCEFDEGSRCDLFSLMWFPYAQSILSQDSIQWMADLPEFLHFEYAGKPGIVVHGSYFKTADFIFASTPWEEKARNFAATQTEIVLSGHCGLPFADAREGLHWLNAGVIGMPANDGTTRVWYMLMDDADGLSYAHHGYGYNHALAAELMADKPLPAPYAHTLTTGLWDNCDILPSDETESMGVRISL